MARRLFTLWLVKIQDQSNISETTDWWVSAICSRAVQFWSTSTLTTDEGHLWGWDANSTRAFPTKLYQSMDTRLRVSTKNRPQELSFLFIEGYINHHICGQISLVSTGPRRWAGSLLSCWATSDRGLDTGVDLWRLVGILLQHVNSTSRIQQEETSTKVGKCQPHIMEYNQSTLDMQGQCSRDHPLLIIITFNNNNHFVTGITFNNFKRSPFCHNI